MRRSRPIALLLVALGVAACSGSETTTPTTTTVATLPPTTQATTTSSSTTTTELITTTTIPGPTFPLTGLPIPGGEQIVRAAIVAKIDNAPPARPQDGLAYADIVIEGIVNGGITRFAAVFHSRGSDPVGPLRSGRLQDIDMVGFLNRPLFVWSGGNPTVSAAINASDLINMGPNYADGYYRSTDRKAPHNYYTSTSAIWAGAREGWGEPPQAFEFRAAETAPVGEPVSAITITLENITADWRWNPSTSLYERTQNGQPHLDRPTGSILTTNNVVILVMKYSIDITGVPKAQSVGSGEALVFTAGRLVRGTWTRADRLDQFTLLDDQGNPIELTPGRTWIELPRRDNTTWS